MRYSNSPCNEPMRFSRRTVRYAAAPLLYVLMAPIALHLLHRHHMESYRVELGGSDEAFLRGSDSSWGRGYLDHGPYRVRRGVRWMTYFAARMAYHGASLRIPAYVRGGDGEVRLRVHRYGQPGTVHVLGNGALLGSLTFEHDSYPWDVRRLKVPARLFRPDGLRLDFELEQTAEDVDLPPGAVLAFDWVEIAPSGNSAYLSIRTVHWVLALVLPLLVYATLRWALGSLWIAEGLGMLVFIMVLLAYGSEPGATTAALEHLWLAFPLGGLVWVFLRAALRVEPSRARLLSTLFTLVLLAHSTIIFWPDHAPPDVNTHMSQLNRLTDPRWTKDRFWEFSSSYTKDGRVLSLGRYHPDATFRTPYPPTTYFMIHGFRKLVNRPRFLLEYLAMVSGATIVLFTWELARRLSSNPESAYYSAALVALDIALWHHASRSHTPAVVGMAAFVAAATYLVSRYDAFHRRSIVYRFTLVSLAAALAYSATLVHFVVFIMWLTLLACVGQRSLVPDRLTRRVLTGSVAGTLASVALFYRNFIGDTWTWRDVHATSAAYRPPATLLFLRNQVRDTVRIFKFGYPFWVLVALPAYFKLQTWASGLPARRVIYAWTATVATFVVLKDPLFFPRLLLQVKEDLLYAPLACVLGGMTLSRLASRGLKGKLAVTVVLFLLLGLYMRDYLFNADMVSVWAATQR